jgi:glutamate synthase domain-containing protein 2/CDGSH-type Zn-finger protein
MADKPRITPLPDGPYLVEGLVDLVDLDGKIPSDGKIALCRCGESKNKPFCDGTHAAIGFTGENQGGNSPDRRDSYVGKQITIHDNRGICAHAGFCTEGLPKVWRMNTEPWIDPDGATAEEIIEVVKRCPSGALSYSIDDIEYRDDENRSPSVLVAPKGPYAIKGSCELVGGEFGEGASLEHYDLCRCGGSKNKPFCDGSHWTVWEEEGTGETRQADAPSSAGTSVAAPSAAGPRPTPEEPHVAFIHQLAREGLTKLGHDGPMGAMGVPRAELPTWDHIQIMAAQLDPQPLLEDVEVETELVIGPKAQRPLHLKIPLFVSDMSFGALSEEAKVALAKGAELAGTGICSGEGGMLPDEQAANRRYFYELASAKFGYREELLERVQAFHFKGGQGAKTGTGGHLPAQKNVGRISEVRNIPEGTPAISPATFEDLHNADDFKRFADRVREVTGGIPVGFKLSANRIERDIDFALDASADYIILDGRGGGTGAAPLIFRNNISVPTIPALARARHHLDKRGLSGQVTLIVTGGLRIPADFVKALALGADGVALSNSAIQAVGCVGARICNTNQCPSGVATQDPALRALIDVEESASRLARFFGAAVELMKVLARACGHNHLNQFNRADIATWDRPMADLTGIDFAGFNPDR